MGAGGKHVIVEQCVSVVAIMHCHKPRSETRGGEEVLEKATFGLSLDSSGKDVKILPDTFRELCTRQREEHGDARRKGSPSLALQCSCPIGNAVNCSFRCELVSGRQDRCHTGPPRQSESLPLSVTSPCL